MAFIRKSHSDAKPSKSRGNPWQKQGQPLRKLLAYIQAKWLLLQVNLTILSPLGSAGNDTLILDSLSPTVFFYSSPSLLLFQYHCDSISHLPASPIWLIAQLGHCQNIGTATCFLLLLTRTFGGHHLFWQHFYRLCSHGLWNQKDDLSDIEPDTVSIFYTFIRVYLLVALFAGLRDVPAGVYQDVQWTKFVPHV
jgi:hypothetical protein